MLLTKCLLKKIKQNKKKQIISHRSIFNEHMGLASGRVENIHPVICVVCEEKPMNDQDFFHFFFIFFMFDLFPDCT